MTAPPRFVDCGDTAFGVEFGDGIDRATNARVMALHARLKAARADGAAPGLIETVPSFRSLLVVYDPVATDRARMEVLVREHLDGTEGTSAPAARWRLPVCYDADLAPDLDSVADACGLPAAEVVRLHAAGTYTVWMLGFMPGFAYMGGLAQALERPRRSEPRVTVPAGSVAIAGRLTTVYPWPSPGGWHLIGRCPIALFDARRPRPVLLSAGDTVRFVPVDRARFDALAKAPPDPDTWRDGA